MSKLDLVEGFAIHLLLNEVAVLHTTAGKPVELAWIADAFKFIDLCPDQSRYVVLDLLGGSFLGWRWGVSKTTNTMES